MLSVNNEQLNYYRILCNYTYTENSKWLITLSCHWHYNTAYINFWRVVLSFESFLGDRTDKFWATHQTDVIPKAFSLHVQSHKQKDMEGLIKNKNVEH